MANRTKSSFKGSCNKYTCDIYHKYFVVNDRKFAKTSFIDVESTESELSHLYEAHLREWGEYQERQASIATTQLAKVQAKLDAANALVKTLKSVKQKPIEGDLIIDPKNHIDGICDALISKGTEIYKCTDPVRVNKYVCALHLNHRQVMKPAAKTTDASTDTASTDSSE